MNATHVDWMPTIGIAVLGLIIGAILVFRLLASERGATRKKSSESLELRDLEAKRDVLIEQLRELDDTAAKQTPEDLAKRRFELELETAQAMRAIDLLVGAAKATATTAATPRGSNQEETAAATPAPRSAMKGFAWGVGSSLAIAAVVFFAMSSATERGEGGSATGGLPGAAGQQQMQQQLPPEIIAMKQDVANDPENIEKRMALARASMMVNDLMEVFDQTQFVLERQPQHAQALSFQALVRLAMGQGDTALQMLTQATTIDPQLIDGWIHLALVNVEMGRTEDAQKAIDEAIARHPEQEGQLRQFFEQMKAAALAQPAPAAGMAAGGEMPPDHPPIPDSPAAGPADAANAKDLMLTLDLDAVSTAGAPPTSVIYIIARPAGMQQGPPVAVKRIQASAFPITVRFGSADSMMGQPLPEQVLIEARLDSDGDAATRSPDDAVATADEVAAGGSLTLTLKK